MRILACLALALALAVPLRADEPPPTEHRTIRVKPTATLSVNHAPKGRSNLFQIDLPTGKPALLRVSEPGYVTQWRTITPSPNDSSTIEIALERAPIPVLFRGEVPAVVLWGQHFYMGWLRDLIGENQWGIQKVLVFIVSVIALGIAALRSTLVFDSKREKLLNEAREQREKAQQMRLDRIRRQRQMEAENARRMQEAEAERQRQEELRRRMEDN